MNNYLDIAESILRRERRPMGSRMILEYAYRLNLVPNHLYGHTQHKTLQARLSTDILNKKNESRFFRTEPGFFFLREFLIDQTIPEKHRQPIKARRRIRDLKKGAVLCIHTDMVEALNTKINKLGQEDFSEFDDQGWVSFFDASKIPLDYKIITCFSIFQRKSDCLSYRIGRYRHDEDNFTAKRTIGFTSFVSEFNQNLFSRGNLGFIDSALTALSIDLDIPVSNEGITHEDVDIDMLVNVPDETNNSTVLLVMRASCPDWFEPTARRLSINDLKWLSCEVPPNNRDDFDPWSQAVLDKQFEG